MAQQTVGELVMAFGHSVNESIQNGWARLGVWALGATAVIGGLYTGYEYCQSPNGTSSAPADIAATVANQHHLHMGMEVTFGGAAGVLTIMAANAVCGLVRKPQALPQIENPPAVSTVQALEESVVCFV